jgi:hypothetical protein
MTRIGVRLARLALRLPVPQPIPERDLTRLTEAQRARLAGLDERYGAAGLDGLTTPELEEAAELLAILEGDPMS